MYYFEKEAQPEAFKSVVHAMWWSVCTLTTVGYGDVTPVTFAGRFFASLVAILGIGVVAIPTGLLTASFMSTVKDTDKKKDDQIKLSMYDIDEV